MFQWYNGAVKELITHDRVAYRLKSTSAVLYQQPCINSIACNFGKLVLHCSSCLDTACLVSLTLTCTALQEPHVMQAMCNVALSVNDECRQMSRLVTFLCHVDGRKLLGYWATQVHLPATLHIFCLSAMKLRA